MQFLKLMMLLMLMVMAKCVASQDFSSEVREKMKALHFMAGEWRGEGWAYTGHGKAISIVDEHIAYELDSTIMVLRGIGTRKLDDGNEEIVHDALAVLSYDVFRKEYTLHTFIARGLQTKANVEVKDKGHIVWWFRTGPEQTIRYTLKVQGDHWEEIGERTSDATTWQQFFAMSLTRIN